MTHRAFSIFLCCWVLLLLSISSCSDSNSTPDLTLDGDDVTLCSSAEDCPDGMYCTEMGICVSVDDGLPDQALICDDSKDCPPGMVCGDDGVCHEGDFTCSDDENCPSGMVCEEGNCVPEGDQVLTCSEDSHCPDGMECRDGFCWPSSEDGDIPTDGDDPDGDLDDEDGDVDGDVDGDMDEDDADGDAEEQELLPGRRVELPATVDFGSAILWASQVRTITLRSIGTETVSILAVSLENDAEGDYSLIQEFTGAVNLASGETLDVSLQLLPSIPGVRSGTLRIETNDTEQTVYTLDLTMSYQGVGLLDVQPDMTVDFGLVAMDVAAPLTREVTLRNLPEQTDTNRVLTFTGIELSGSTQGFSLVSMPFEVEQPYLPPGEANARSFQLAFMPQTPGEVSVDVVLSYNDGESNQEARITLIATGTSPMLDAPNGVHFGLVGVGNTVTRQVLLANTGGADLTLSTVEFAGEPANSAFSLQLDGDLPALLSPGESLVATLSYTPDNQDADYESLHVVSDSYEGADRFITVDGSGVYSSVRVLPPFLNFGHVVLGSHSEKTLELTNLSVDSLNIEQVWIPEGLSTVSLVEPDPSSFPLTLQPDEILYLTFAYAPLAEDEVNEELFLQILHGTDTEDVPVPVSGQGVLPHLVRQPPEMSVDFGQVVVGSRKEQRVRFANFGLADLHLTQITVDEGSSVFSVEPSTDTHLLPGGSLELRFIAEPPTGTSLENVTGSITLHTDDPDQPVLTYTLAAEIIDPQLSLIPSENPFEFGFGEVGAPAISQSFTLSNIGVGLLEVEDIQLIGDDADAFRLEVSTELPVSLDAGEVPFTLTFVPTQERSYNASLNILSNDRRSPDGYLLALTAQGVDCPLDYHFCEDLEPQSCTEGQSASGAHCCVPSTTPEHCGYRCDACPTIDHATALCSYDSFSQTHYCDVSCDEGYVYYENACVEIGDPNDCGGNGPCDTPGAYEVVACIAGTCRYFCDEGYHRCGDDVCYDDTDATHCGQGCAVCPSPEGGTPYCSFGQCEVACNSGLHLCPDDTCRENGDVNFCGDSCEPCVQPDGGEVSCQGGQCVQRCPEGTHPCNDVCVPDNDLNHCGSACAACPEPEYALSFCAEDDLTGFFYCDFTCQDGFFRQGDVCEQEGDPNCCGPDCMRCPAPPAYGDGVCVDDECTFRCFDGFHLCEDGQCQPNDSNQYCGPDCETCSSPGFGNVACVGGNCTPYCPEGLRLCPDSICRVDTEVTSCGAFCEECEAPTGGSVECVDGNCVTHCPDGTHECNGACVGDHLVSSCGESCSACVQPANGVAECVLDNDNGSYACDFTCNSGLVKYNGGCVAAGDVNCCGLDGGGECIVCPGAPNSPESLQNGELPACVNNQCVVVCDTGYHGCGDGHCYANADINHCGSACDDCHEPNNGYAACVAGSCRQLCDLGHHLCEDDHCYPDDDTANCGSNCENCIAPTNGDVLCEEGQCVPQCPEDYHACADNQCHEDTDITACGDACLTCPDPGNGIPFCIDGECRPNCDPGYHNCNGVCRADDDSEFCGAECSACPVPARGHALCINGVCDMACDDESTHHLCPDGHCYRDTDVYHCGEGCLICDDPDNGIAACENDQCVNQCDTGYHRCSGDDTCYPDTDIEHCGDSCETCSMPPHGLAYCVGGLCVETCEQGYHRCADGLCYRDDDADNCGSQCLECPDPEYGIAVCVNGQCDAGCDRGFHMCPDNQCYENTDATHCGDSCNLCEAPEGGWAECINDSCAKACPDGEHVCLLDNTCYPNDDIAHCGANCLECPAPENGTAACVNGQCIPSCNAGYHGCNDGLCWPNNDTSHCGEDCRVCEVQVNGYAYCDGECHAVCDPGYRECADGNCYSVTDITHCGPDCIVCPVPNNGRTVCVDDECSSFCDPQHHLCGDGNCYADSDVTHCGDDCVVCEAGDHGGAQCIAGECVMACDPGYHACSDDLGNTSCERDDDPNACGTTCEVCPAPAGGNATCINGTCDYDCPNAWHACLNDEGQPQCYPAQDPDHCGEGCDVCPAPDAGFANCNNGLCEQLCNSGRHLCDDGDDTYTCRLNSDPDYCGDDCQPCERPIAGLARCLDGGCEMDCYNGYHLCEDPDGSNHCYEDDNERHCGDTCTDCTTNAPAGGLAMCLNGACSYDCQDGHHLCADENECFPNTDTTHCGDACTDCAANAPDGSISSCVNGGCEYTCPNGTHLCAADNECFPNTDTTHCGDACTDCAANAPDGSISSCVNGGCEYTCPGGTHLCAADNECFPNTDTTHCGDACTDCAANAPDGSISSCVNGGCEYTCPNGTHLCEADNECFPNTDTTHCGDACTDCAANAPDGSISSCVNGGCEYSCPNGTHLCEADNECFPNTDTSHCGDACVDCSLSGPTGSNASCVNGGCEYSCPNGTHLCEADNECFGNTDPGHCGGDCTDCSDGQPVDSNASCVNGGCEYTCSIGDHMCDDGCHANTDPSHCGTACEACVEPDHGDRLCVNDDCDWICDSYYRKNGGMTECTVGNEATCCLPNNTDACCGATCNSCPPSGSHTVGECYDTGNSSFPFNCRFACESGWVDYDGNFANGCECQYIGEMDPVGDGVDQNCDGVDGIGGDIYVSKAGLDTNDGSYGQPVQSISTGIQRAVDGGYSNVLVTGGLYAENLILQAGVNVLGGYTDDFNLRDVQNNQTVLLAVTPEVGEIGAVTAIDITDTPTEFSGFSITALQADGESESTYGVYIRDCDETLVLQHNRIDGARAGDGEAGLDGSAGQAGQSGTRGSDAAYAGTVPAVCSDEWVYRVAAYSADVASFTEVTLDLTPYAEYGDVQLRWRLYSNGSDQAVGWNLDDVSLNVDGSIVFADDFESGTAAWTLDAPWAQDTTLAANGTASLADSPDSYYANDQNISATITQVFNFAGASSVSLTFNHQLDRAGGDTMYVELLLDGLPLPQGGSNMACPAAAGGDGGVPVCNVDLNTVEAGGTAGGGDDPGLGGEGGCNNTITQGGCGLCNLGRCNAEGVLHQAGYPGTDGSLGADGLGGSGALDSGELNASGLWTPYTATGGTAGSNGSGGGGGGSGAGVNIAVDCADTPDRFGASGGGGGAGGCLGQAGAAGTSGGSSFAVLVVFSSSTSDETQVPVLMNNEIIAGRGGRGGDGGRGGAGGSGGAGGTGGEEGIGALWCAYIGGNGGAGGRGGHGGGGGGGAGGVAYGLYVEGFFFPGGDLSSYVDDNSYSFDAGSQGGLGGQGGNGGWASNSGTDGANGILSESNIP